MIPAGPRWDFRRALLASALAALLLSGCGSGTVKPSRYVRSLCTALANWRNTVQSAGVAFQDSGALTASPAVAKQDYQRYVSALAKATKHAGDALPAAGAPAVRRGKQIADRLTRAFQRAGRELAKAGAQAASIPTDSGSTFQLGASAVNAEIETAFRRIAAVSPGQSAQLRAAAAKQPTCQVLR